MTTAETVEGVVESRNDSGIRISGEWRNRSRFKPVDLPAVGTLVRLGLDGKGFITSLEVLDTAASSAQPAGRDQTSTRLAVLKAAAAFCASRPEARAAHVTALADQWLAWVEGRRGPVEEGG